MKSQIALTLALVVGGLALTVGPALAGKGGGGSGGSIPAPPTIAIATINGTSAASTQDPAPKLGDNVTFATVDGSMAGWEYPMVVVSCYQDVNGDGTIDTNLLGPDIVYSWVDHPGATFLLGAASSIWTNRGGGPATCRAELDAYGWKQGKETIRFLAGTQNWTAQG
jgi:hypothetical protein